ncbi:hypothetical protein [Anabaena sp. AL93]|jgi:hypothetical protein|uniref:hypothetical protein n=1 Tax=Anabaena sp. AL93 TaxID=1678133 RepID=UPI0007FE6FDE|nr:hypothetical protein [Anabaena sp. AL93]OBQ17351.1 MAG: hypothetical protein AN486_15485 [Anabaena sp. AL93]
MLNKLNFKKKLSFIKSIDKLRGIIANLYRQPILMEKTDILPALAEVDLKLTVYYVSLDKDNYRDSFT